MVLRHQLIYATVPDASPSSVLLRWCLLQTLIHAVLPNVHLLTTAIALLPISDPHPGAGVHEAERHQAKAPARVTLYSTFPTFSTGDYTGSSIAV
jgi:hypothetical protein